MTDDGDLGRTGLDWPETDVVYLTLDLECDFGTALAKNTYEALEYLPRFISLLEGHDLPLTCFVQTELLDEHPEAVEELRSADVEVSFHPHSHTHPTREDADVEYEVEMSTERFEAFFGESPTGYRFPNGDVRGVDYAQLASHDYEFDASVFPTWRPGHFDNRTASTKPVYFGDYDLVEIPFTVMSSWMRIPTALSFARLFGRPFTWLLSRRPPQPIVFNVHLHDLGTPPSYHDLSPMYRAVYARNSDGFGLLERLVSTFADAGYEFEQLDSAYGSLADRNDYSR